ncbi:SRPBCC family protein [Nocardioides iriomotensis]|uniref:Carbon monoxide dehydrogenase n=1 Tax=Nocardioides iriomotensis TaxID=715784 RepID=A0A4Q5IYT9_9ACTN|nr:carbon monoxide dehydrogenase subunit G [Nocardioides iriomotensis]RYU11173.1 carbon monoxide dehydrogenase [Nocardioides iriomotensis]
MKVSGTSTLKADPDTLWKALNDPAVLVATIPGCQRLEALGGDTFAMTVAAGVGSIKGVYDGQYSIADQAEPGTYLMRARGSGAAGTIDATVAVRLQEAEDDNGGTLLSYDADAVVGGMIGGVGQRMLTGVSKKMATEFFGNIDRYLAGERAAEPEAAVSTGSTTRGAVFTAPAAAPSASNDFVKGLLVGGAIALAGAVVGGWIAGRRR